MAELRIQHLAALGLVTNETTFDENGGVLGVAENGKIGCLHTAIGRAHVLDQFILYALGKLL